MDRSTSIVSPPLPSSSALPFPCGEDLFDFFLLPLPRFGEAGRLATPGVAGGEPKGDIGDVCCGAASRAFRVLGDFPDLGDAGGGSGQAMSTVGTTPDAKVMVLLSAAADGPPEIDSASALSLTSGLTAAASSLP